ncbi:low-density lipoprotein receptor class A domain-containing protein 1 isoform X2 [Castor canadensis]|uniref:Low-density lipoprotein receptor class A domain-containing protein 1 isoform X2 n=1 Tax=Castor canadensis TaxID=51338 RepID=A0AC58MXB2_CASCN
MGAGAMNKIFPQGDMEGNTAAGRKAHPGEEGCGPFCCSRRGACLSAFVLLLLAMLTALLVLVAILGFPSCTPGAQACVTPTNRTGFLCHDQRSCIPAHRVCDGIHTCPHGEDEDESLCRDVPQSLLSFLVAHCGDPASWIYSDQKCDGINNCGDCSDELSPGEGPSAGWARAGDQVGAGGWRLTRESLRLPVCPPCLLGSFLLWLEHRQGGYSASL